MTPYQLPPTSALPLPIQRYALTGTPPSAWKRDLVAASNQVPRWGYLALAVTAAWYARRAYGAWRHPAA